jgi:predicted transcriptional regulator
MYYQLLPEYTMRTRETITISLPPAMLKDVKRVCKEEHRTQSELLREALRTYFLRRLPEVTPTRAELNALKRGREAMRRGDYLTYNQFIHAMDTPRRQTRRKKT